MHYYISVTVDLDPDGVTITGDRQYLAWNGLRYLKELRNLIDHFGGVVTWFIRADDQIAELCGSLEYLFKENDSFWNFVRNCGDEIALHPHLYDWHENAKIWKPSLDPKKYCDQLRRIHKQLFQSGFYFESVRIGEGFNSNELMKCIDGLGFKVDSTAIPGRIRNSGDSFFDWSSTLNVPYNPSFYDYRVSGEASLKLIEVPITTAQFFADYDLEPKLRYMSLSYKTSIFSQGFEKYILQKGGGEGEVSPIIFIVHPGEIFDGGRAGLERGLYSFDIQAVSNNLQYALQTITSNGHSYSFINTSEFADEKFKKIKWT